MGTPPLVGCLGPQRPMRIWGTTRHTPPHTCPFKFCSYAKLACPQTEGPARALDQCVSVFTQCLRHCVSVRVHCREFELPSLPASVFKFEFPITINWHRAVAPLSTLREGLLRRRAPNGRNQQMARGLASGSSAQLRLAALAWLGRRGAEAGGWPPGPPRLC